MKKTIFYLPAIIFTIFYGFAVTAWSIGAVSPIVVIWLSLFFISGFILSRNVYWGGLLGALPAINLIYMGTQETGQIINEMPIGVTILIYYITCGYIVLINNRKGND
ncbi:hypothetical protein SAMN00017405_1619 [Desulfonispora thiosulfatigenes DSM 11270]|uniref:Uncharacterized protein n=1 Tax=Desulfonispora thiosulfatigenes DSM 11270 TaxID=656914 RepID=A0A1W1UVU1_DESTI|nr:hypothetical protein [Desulfonispora thiosulfatigenes]SMB85203.1 hypothetical protein SAMN00017405_1619 [Desulfonispora thiosulfatigenes DSM 11270]